MARVRWPLLNHQPRIQVTLTLAPSGQSVVRNLLADTGAGTRRARFELLLDEQDCLHCGGLPAHSVVLGGAYSGSFPVYLLRVQIPALAFDRHVPVVGISHCPAGFEGIACFRFLNRFSYGNFADPGGFALEL
jgi:hypothetical protein